MPWAGDCEVARLAAARLHLHEGRPVLFLCDRTTWPGRTRVQEHLGVATYRQVHLVDLDSKCLAWCSDWACDLDKATARRAETCGCDMQRDQTAFPLAERGTDGTPFISKQHISDRLCTGSPGPIYM